MDSDKSFSLYAVLLISAAAAVISASVMSGIATLPTPLFVAEHLGMGLLFRASYKSFGGVDWPFVGAGSETPAAPAEPTAGSGITADAAA